jgi:hypothetical protein
MKGKRIRSEGISKGKDSHILIRPTRHAIAQIPVRTDINVSPKHNDVVPHRRGNRLFVGEIVVPEFLAKAVEWGAHNIVIVDGSLGESDAVAYFQDNKCDQNCYDKENYVPQGGLLHWFSGHRNYPSIVGE